MASTLTLTESQLTNLVQQNYPNLQITGFHGTRDGSYGRYFFFNARAKLDPSNPIWTSSDGRTTPVSQMARTHVENALACVIRGERQLDEQERTFWVNAFSRRLAQTSNE